MLELHQVNTFYGNIQVLHDISLEIEQGEIITLIGANGAGKSTTLMSVSGIVPAASRLNSFQGCGNPYPAARKHCGVGIVPGSGGPAYLPGL